MATDFETWAMRGLILVLGYSVAYLGKRAILLRDKHMDEQAEAHSLELAAMRKEFGTHLQEISSQTNHSFDSFNSGLSHLNQTLTELRITLAEKYVTFDDLKEHHENCRHRRATDSMEKIA